MATAVPFGERQIGGRDVIGDRQDRVSPEQRLLIGRDCGQRQEGLDEPATGALAGTVGGSSGDLSVQAIDASWVHSCSCNIAANEFK